MAGARKPPPGGDKKPRATRTQQRQDRPDNTSTFIDRRREWVSSNKGMTIAGIGLAVVVALLATLLVFNIGDEKSAATVTQTEAVTETTTVTTTVVEGTAVSMPACIRVRQVDNGNNRWFADGVEAVRNASNDVQARRAAGKWLKLLSHDPDLLAGAAGYFFDREVDPSTLAKGKCLSGKGRALLAELELALAGATIEPDMAPADGLNSGVSDSGEVVAAAVAGLKGDRRSVKITMPDGTVIWILGRCGNLVTQGPPPPAIIVRKPPPAEANPSLVTATATAEASARAECPDGSASASAYASASATAWAKTYSQAYKKAWKKAWAKAYASASAKAVAFVRCGGGKPPPLQPPPPPKPPQPPKCPNGQPINPNGTCPKDPMQDPTFGGSPAPDNQVEASQPPSPSCDTPTGYCPGDEPRELFPDPTPELPPSGDSGSASGNGGGEDVLPPATEPAETTPATNDPPNSGVVDQPPPPS